MGRVKFCPRLAQPDLVLQEFSPTAQAMSNAINAYQLRNNQFSGDEGIQHTNKQVIAKTPIAMAPEPSGTEEHSAEQLVNTRQPVSITNLECPHCGSNFSDMSIKEFREHVESCTRTTTGNSGESTTSSLSPPPASHHGDEGDDDAAHLTPYEIGEFTSYPASKGDAVEDEAFENAGAQPKYNMPKLTDAEKFVDAFDGAEDMSYGNLYKRVLAAQQALVRWQDEWMELDRFIEITEPPTTTAKTHKNPRIPKETKIGIGYQDELESFMYGFEYQYHATKVGNQNPRRQRYTNGSNNARELRQRVPTQKAVEADLSSTPDSEDGISGRRRNRGQRLLVDVDPPLGRGQRVRNNSRIDSESRDQTPMAILPSVKKRGRPAKPRTIGASRLQELQLEDGIQSDSTLEPAHNQKDGPTSEQLATTAKRASHGGQPLETTEYWNDLTDTDEPASRPGTSGSTMTGPSTDDMRNPPVRSSARNRRRQNTSDFEDALPSHKRIGRRPNKLAVDGNKGPESTKSLADGNGTEKTRNMRRARQEEDTLPGVLDATGNSLAESRSKSQDAEEAQSNSAAKDNTNMQKKQSGRARKIITLKTSSGIPLTSANPILAKEVTTDPLPGTSAQQDGKDGPKVSRASLNMMRRWAAKKQAEALGLPVPKIGRYPKGGSVLSTPDVAGVPDLINSPKPFGGRKRKRDEEELNAANVGVSDTIAAEAPIIIKKRGGRPRKVLSAVPPFKSAGQSINSEGNGLNTSPSEKEGTKEEEPALIIAPKRKGGRPRKRPLHVDEIADGGAQHVREGSGQNPQVSLDHPVDALGQADATIVTAPRQGDRHVNDNDLAAAADPEKSEPAPMVRKSSRVRRQTSAAASSQTGTRPSSRSSHKMTITPTPAPSQQPPEGTVIKQEPVAGSALLRKRGRRPKMAEAETSPETTVVPANIEDDGAPPRKRRKVICLKIGGSAGSTPGPALDTEEGLTTSQEEAGLAQKSGSRKRKNSALDTPVRDVLSDTHATSAEPSLPRKRPRKSPIEDTPATGFLSDARASSVEPFVSRKKAGRPRKDATGGVVSELPIDAPLKAEDVTTVQGPLTTRARSSGQDNVAKFNSTEDLPDIGRRVADPGPPKKKGTWGGKRTKGVSVSSAASAPVITPGLDVISRTDGFEDRAERSNSKNSDNTSREPPKKGTWGGPRHKKVPPVSAPPSGDISVDTVAPAGSSNTSSRPRRTMSKAVVSADEMGINDEAREASSHAVSRPKRVGSTKVASMGEVAGDDTEVSPTAAFIKESISPDLKKTEKKKGGWGGKRVKGEKVSAMAAAPTATASRSEPVVNAEINGDAAIQKVESGNGDSDSEATAKEKRKAAAKASKSAKMSRSMKGRWADGSMHEIMRRKKATNAAKKAAAARVAKTGEVEVAAEPITAPASAPTRRKAVSTKDGGRAPKRRRTVNATMDGAADTDTDSEMPEESSSGPPSPISRKVSEFERYKQLSSPLRSAHGRRGRRPAALRASQSFSKFTDDDDMEIMDNNEEDEEEDEEDEDEDEDEDEETGIKKQFKSELEHFRNTTPPFRGLESSNILIGKRKRKPVMNLEEAMRIEAGDEDDFSTEG